MKNETHKNADLDEQQIKKAIHDSLDSFIQRTSEELGVYPERIAKVAFYRLQRHSIWGRNATRTQKNAAYKHWNGVCYRCKEPVERAHSKFHHLARGVPNQHAPCNLVPIHTSCHDDEHNVINGSLSKGEPCNKKTK